MTFMLNRRQFLTSFAALSTLSLFELEIFRAAPAAENMAFGEEIPFSFDDLQAQAKALAAGPYQSPVIKSQDVLETIDYDAYQKIRYRTDKTLWTDGSSPYAAQLFHLGRYFQAPVQIHVVVDGMAREIIYSSDLFEFGDADLARKLPADLGFAGFRLMDADATSTDWAAFLGATYFRTAGELNQYGLSTRGLAIDTATKRPEEFPRFTHFWLELPAQGDKVMSIYALMDSPSIAGAYRIDTQKDKGVTMHVHAALFPRHDIGRMGIAPLTSMFWYAENNRHQAADWRPEIHDNDGLAIWTGAGERIWRPLNNPPSVQTSSFFDQNPRGFGLLQRDRNFYNYEDDGVFYDRRPSLWVEPLGEWGNGAVQLVEIPTDDEIHDNIVAYWVSESAVAAGSEWTYRYKLHWLADEPYPAASVGRVIATRLGKGGIPGQPRPPGSRKFVIDFEGGPLEQLKKLDEVEPVVTASRGELDNIHALQVVGFTRWRAFFDVYADGAEPVDLRCYLRLGDTTLTETWLYQYTPFEF